MEIIVTDNWTRAREIVRNPLEKQLESRDIYPFRDYKGNFSELTQDERDYYLDVIKALRGGSTNTIYGTAAYCCICRFVEDLIKYSQNIYFNMKNILGIHFWILGVLSDIDLSVSKSVCAVENVDYLAKDRYMVTLRKLDSTIGGLESHMISLETYNDKEGILNRVMKKIEERENDLDPEKVLQFSLTLD